MTYLEAGGAGTIGTDMFTHSKDYQTTTDANGVKIDHMKELQAGETIYQSMKSRNFNKNNLFLTDIGRVL